MFLFRLRRQSASNATFTLATLAAFVALRAFVALDAPATLGSRHGLRRSSRRADPPAPNDQRRVPPTSHLEPNGYGLC